MAARAARLEQDQLERVAEVVVPDLVDVEAVELREPVRSVGERGTGSPCRPASASPGAPVAEEAALDRQRHEPEAGDDVVGVQSRRLRRSSRRSCGRSPPAPAGRGRARRRRRRPACGRGGRSRPSTRRTGRRRRPRRPSGPMATTPWLASSTARLPGWRAERRQRLLAEVDRTGRRVLGDEHPLGARGDALVADERQVEAGDGERRGVAGVGVHDGADVGHRRAARRRCRAISLVGRRGPSHSPVRGVDDRVVVRRRARRRGRRPP